MLTDQFFINIKQLFIDNVLKHNRGELIKTKKWVFENGDAEVNVSRGNIFEKACVTAICTTVTLPGRDYQSKIQWLGIQTFPANHHVPMFMGGFEHISERGEEHYPGYFDICSFTPCTEDSEYVTGKMKLVTDKYNKSYQELTDRYSKIFHVRESTTGIGSGGGIAFDEEEKNFKFTQDTELSICETYFDIVEKKI